MSLPFPPFLHAARAQGQGGAKWVREDPGGMNRGAWAGPYPPKRAPAATSHAQSGSGRFLEWHSQQPSELRFGGLKKASEALAAEDDEHQSSSPSVSCSTFTEAAVEAIEGVVPGGHSPVDVFHGNRSISFERAFGCMGTKKIPSKGLLDPTAND